MKITLGIGTFALAAIALGACGGAPSGESIDNDDSQISATCGVKPKAPVCQVEKCDPNAGFWEPVPLAAGTVCQTTGHCDGNGSCVIPPPPAISPPPRNLTVYNSNAHQMILEYACGANATSHQIYRQTNGGAFGKLFGPTDGCPAGTWVDWDNYLIPGATYCYYVVGYNSAHQAQSNTVCVTDQLDTTVPALPTGRVVPTLQGAVLTFHDQATNEDGYHVSFRRVGAPMWNIWKTYLNPNPAIGIKDETYGQTDPGPDFKYVMNNLDPLSEYEFKVTVFHDHAPESADVVFPSFKPIPPRPTPPTNLHATAIGDTFIQIAWTPGTGQDDYILTLDRAMVNGLGSHTVPGTDVGENLTPLLPGTRYCVTLSGENRGGTSVSTPLLCTTTTGTAPPPHLVSHTDGIWMRPPSVPDNGFVLNVGLYNPVSGGLIDSLVLTRNSNDSRLRGVMLVRPGTTNGSACNDPSAIFVALDTPLTAAQMTTLYGSARPSLASGVTVEGCPVWNVLPPTLQTITMTINYSAPQ